VADTTVRPNLEALEAELVELQKARKKAVTKLFEASYAVDRFHARIDQCMREISKVREIRKAKRR